MKIVILAALIFIFLILLVSPVMAVKHVSREYFRIHETQNIMGAIGLWWAQTTRWLSLTMISGYLCSSYPDESGCRTGATETVYCPAHLSGGCAVVLYNADWQFLQEVQIPPGSYTIVSYPAVCWENYYCNLDCSCTLFQDGGCGAGPCTQSEMLRQRTCIEDCSEETVCIWRSVCEGPTPPQPICDNGICEPGETYQNCPADCTQPHCGNLVCDPSLGENSQTCPTDCPDWIQQIIQWVINNWLIVIVIILIILGVGAGLASRK